jgi:hypothetical protein
VRKPLPQGAACPTLPGGKLMLLSRSFVRKRVISLATTATVGATSLAFAHGPTPARDQFHRAAAPIQYVADRPDRPDETPFLAENDAAMNRMMADMTVNPTGDITVNLDTPRTLDKNNALDLATVQKLGRQNGRKFLQVAFVPGVNVVFGEFGSNGLLALFFLCQCGQGLPEAINVRGAVLCRRPSFARHNEILERVYN